MLLLSILFTAVCLLFIYALMRDTGDNTPDARATGHVLTPDGATKQARRISSKETQAVSLS